MAGIISALWVGAGGALGAMARYGMGLIPWQSQFPLMTFLVNFLGSVLIGFVAAAAELHPGTSKNLVLFLKTGLCGGFTTFSTFSLEVLNLLDAHKWGMGCAYAAASLVCCVVGVVLGRALAKAVLS